MNNEIKIFHVISAIIVMILGTLLHFSYKWSGSSPFVALYSAVNESTWEHLKLLFFPMLLTSVIGYNVIFKDSSPANFWCSRCCGILISLSFTVAFFYTYSGILGKNIAIIDIASFFVSVILGEHVSYVMMRYGLHCNNSLAILILVFFTFCFFTFTFKSPRIGLFKDPITGSYGIQ